MKFIKLVMTVPCQYTFTLLLLVTGTQTLLVPRIRNSLKLPQKNIFLRMQVDGPKIGVQHS